MANIKEVAKLAGVSVSTVSNILNGKTSVSEELYQKVMQAMRELNYHPNLLAMNLRKNKYRFVGVVIDRLSGHYHQILEGIYREMDRQKCQPIVKIVNSIATERDAIETLISLSVSGIIVVSSNLNASLEEKYRTSSIPIVFADYYPKETDMNTVCFDNYRIVKELTEQLIQKGDTVGLITGDSFLGSENDCISGYNAGIEGKKQKSIRLETILDKERSFATILRFISKMSNVPDSFVVSNEHIAKNLNEVISLLHLMDKEIYVLAGDSWYDSTKGIINYVKREAILCGIEAAKLLLANIEESITFDTQKIVVGFFDDIPALINKKRDCITAVHTKGRKAKKELRFLMLESRVSSAVSKLADDFTAQTGISVRIETALQTELKNKILELSEKGDDKYDILMADLQWTPQLNKNKVFRKLNGLMDFEELLPRYIHDFRGYVLSSSEEVYALPILVGSQILAYRKDLFEDAYLKKKYYLSTGLQLNVPHNWNEYNLIARFFTRQYTPDSPVSYGTCLLGSNYEGIMAEYLPRYWSYSGNVTQGAYVDVNSMASIKAVKNLCETYKYSYPYCREFLEEEQIQEFLKDDTAMISTFNVHMPYQIDYAEKNIEFGCIPSKYSLMGGWLIGISAYSKNVDDSIRFMNWEFSNRISVRSSLLGQVSPLKEVFYDNEILTMYPWMDVVNSRNVKPRNKAGILKDDIDPWKEVQIEGTLSNHIWEAILGEKSAEDAMREAYEELNSI